MIQQSSSLNLSSIPWKELYQISHHYLKIQPSEFWQLTMYEWKILIEPYMPNGQIITRADLQQLMQQFPDE